VLRPQGFVFKLEQLTLPEGADIAEEDEVSKVKVINGPGAKKKKKNNVQMI
jgi:hypothetical protein